MMLGIAIFGLIAVTTMVSSNEARESRSSIDDLKARALSQSAIEVGFELISEAAAKATHDPLGGINSLFSGGDTATLLVTEPVMNNGVQVGTYSLTLTRLSQSARNVRVQVDGTGYHGWMGNRALAWHASSVVVDYGLDPSEVFDYAYFVNNWGWLYGNTIEINGNARSNGQFDVAGYKPTITGQPLYEGITWSGKFPTLTGYQDDNEDGLEDGYDGGIFSGWDIVDAGNVKGKGGQAKNQHDFEESVPMPNLSDLTGYKKTAIAEGGTLSIGGMQVSDAVYGDDVGELGNIYLVGTKSDPIELNGPVVIEGDVIISGYVTGQGAIYSEGNVYCPDSVMYLDGPNVARPGAGKQSDTEAWLKNNWEKDFLGLFAAENIVVGDHTDSDWRSYVGNWMGSSLNESAEDAGEDGIPNTSDGKDGIPGTADDDVLEGDGIFTVEYYTQSDMDLGLIPAGKSVGDVIPGTGEDIDGDGVQDGTTSLADIDFGDPLNIFNWGGNMPVGGIANYSDIASMYANQLEAVFYTNHSFCYVVFGKKAAEINGAMVTRNENIVYGTPKIEVNYDCRLLGRADGLGAFFLPNVLSEPEIVRWTDLDNDPNRYVVAP